MVLNVEQVKNSLWLKMEKANTVDEYFAMLHTLTFDELLVLGRIVATKGAWVGKD